MLEYCTDSKEKSEDSNKDTHASCILTMFPYPGVQL